MRDLLAKRAELIERQRAILDGAKAAGRDFTDAEAAEFDSLETQILSLEKQIERERIVSSRMETLDDLADVPYRPKSGGTRGRKEGTGGFECLGEFIYAARFEPGRISAEMRMDTGESGGFAVPPQFREELLQIGPEEAIVRPRANTIEPGDPPDAELTIPALDYRAGAYGGVTVNWINEGGDKPETDAKLMTVTLKPQEVAGYVTVTDKLLRNWRAANGLIRRLLRGAVAAAEDVAFLTGNGVGKPLGVLNSPGALTVNRSLANSIGTADVINMRAKLMPDAVSGAVWVANQSVLPKIVTLKDEYGNYIFIRGDITRGIPDTLLGIPIRWTGRVPALGNKGDLILANFNYYLIKDGSGPFIAASEHVFFRQNKTVIKIFWNVDGQLWTPAPITLEDGVTQVSPVVILDVVAG